MRRPGNDEPAQMTGSRYAAFGLNIRSEFEIPSLLRAAQQVEGPDDVEIVEGEVQLPEGLEDLGGMPGKIEGESCFISIELCGSFQVIGGRRIIVDREPHATPDQVNIYLQGTVLGALLHQRGVLPFHCNAVEFEGAAFLFCGDSGAGKSTLAAYFVERGLRLLSDDLCGLYFSDDGRLMAAPGVARLKLWQESLDVFGRSSDGLKLVPWYDEKFEVALAQDSVAKVLPVGGLYHLRTAEDGRAHGIHPLKGLDAVNAITANIYRRRVADLMGAAPAYLAATRRVLETVPVFTMNRQWGFEHFRKEAMMVEDHMRELVRERSAGS